MPLKTASGQQGPTALHQRAAKRSSLGMLMRFCTVYLYLNLVFLCSKRLHLDFSWRLLFIYLVFCYSLFETFVAPLGMKTPWVESNLMRMEYSMGQMCNETVLLGSTRQKL